ncbi:nucleolar and coiled-body phosphoprotein 1-like isoform X2 [Selaginella moellendorffii]|uniref:nucleolar and coiled-body phosphoprotein 1-like isoform X2 n=1 Tax=Selaginella moellendorffii TaxID=88036 RepID=UPI000D1C8F3B|nr:nucleolar and coiled-body phosphoprotein 1-like isoform X2 [Selaginella moellendorffii]|eukprot:XP_024543645.1 nucleolar and coiled-body phosphoprotein 1-like isoform X2 [Selaginella moellendorffii]
MDFMRGVDQAAALCRACVETNRGTRMLVIVPSGTSAEEFRERVRAVHSTNFPEHGNVGIKNIMIMVAGYWYAFTHGNIGTAAQGTDARFRVELFEELEEVVDPSPSGTPARRELAAGEDVRQQPAREESRLGRAVTSLRRTLEEMEDIRGTGPGRVVNNAQGVRITAPPANEVLVGSAADERNDDVQMVDGSEPESRAVAETDVAESSGQETRSGPSLRCNDVQMVDSSEPHSRAVAEMDIPESNGQETRSASSLRRSYDMPSEDPADKSQNGCRGVSPPPVKLATSDCNVVDVSVSEPAAATAQETEVEAMKEMGEKTVEGGNDEKEFETGRDEVEGAGREGQKLESSMDDSEGSEEEEDDELEGRRDERQENEEKQVEAGLHEKELETEKGSSEKNVGEMEAQKDATASSVLNILLGSSEGTEDRSNAKASGEPTRIDEPVATDGNGSASGHDFIAEKPTAKRKQDGSLDASPKRSRVDAITAELENEETEEAEEGDEAEESDQAEETDKAENSEGGALKNEEFKEPVDDKEPEHADGDAADGPVLDNLCDNVISQHFSSEASGSDSEEDESQAPVENAASSQVKAPMKEAVGKRKTVTSDSDSEDDTQVPVEKPQEEAATVGVKKTGSATSDSDSEDGEELPVEKNQEEAATVGRKKTGNATSDSDSEDDTQVPVEKNQEKAATVGGKKIGSSSSSSEDEEADAVEYQTETQAPLQSQKKSAAKQATAGRKKTTDVDKDDAQHKPGGKKTGGSEDEEADAVETHTKARASLQSQTKTVAKQVTASVSDEDEDDALHNLGAKKTGNSEDEEAEETQTQTQAPPQNQTNTAAKQATAVKKKTSVSSSQKQRLESRAASQSDSEQELPSSQPPKSGKARDRRLSGTRKRGKPPAKTASGSDASEEESDTDFKLRLKGASTPRRNPRRTAVDSRFQMFVDKNDGLDSLFTARSSSRLVTEPDVVPETQNVEETLTGPQGGQKKKTASRRSSQAQTPPVIQQDPSPVMIITPEGVVSSQEAAPEAEKARGETKRKRPSAKASKRRAKSSEQTPAPTRTTFTPAPSPTTPLAPIPLMERMPTSSGKKKRRQA